MVTFAEVGNLVYNHGHLHFQHISGLLLLLRMLNAEC
jgi:hypothetical protein